MPPAFDPAELPYSVNVIWHLRGTTAPRPARCHVIPGYTGPEHLPDMLAIRYLAGAHERDEIVLDHVCRARRWRLAARDASGASLGEVATDDEQLMPALAQVLLGAATPAGTIAQIDVHDGDSKTANRVPAEPAPTVAEPTVYLLTISEPDCFPDEYEAGGKVITADIDLNHVFEGSKTARSAEEATEFVGNLLWQLEGFPAQLRRRAYETAARVVADYPKALRRLDALIGNTADAPTSDIDDAAAAGTDGAERDVRA